MITKQTLFVILTIIIAAMALLLALTCMAVIGLLDMTLLGLRMLTVKAKRYLKCHIALMFGRMTIFLWSSIRVLMGT